MPLRTVTSPRVSSPPAIAGTTPLALDAYGDADTYAAERRRLFDPGHGPLYLGHDVLLPATRAYARADGDDRVLLTRDGDGIVRAFANICTHALRPLVTDASVRDGGCLTCPFHHWSFRLDGDLVGGRSISLDDDERARLGLRRFPTTSWHGAHFGGGDAAGAAFRGDLARIDAAFAARGVGHWLDFSDWLLAADEDTAYHGDWKAFLEVYGDCYHVPPYHPGLASFADCASLEWVFGDAVHLQFLRLSASAGRRSSAYAAWAEGLRAYHAARGEAPAEMAVVWAAVYPNLMLEFYNGLRVVSVVVPTAPDSYRNRVHYFVPPDMEERCPGLVQVVLDAYAETADQDRALNETRHEGVVAARELGLDVEPYHANLTGTAPEAGTVHFHAWWRSRMGQREHRPATRPAGAPARHRLPAVGSAPGTGPCLDTVPDLGNSYGPGPVDRARTTGGSMAINRLNHAVLYVRDAERSAAFYCDVLGFERLPAYRVPGAVFLRAAGSTNDHDLGLFSVGEAAAASPAGSGSVGLYHLAWEVDTLEDLARLADRLAEVGALVGATDHGTTKALYARDPDGIEFEVTWVVPAELLTPGTKPAGRPLDLPAELARYGPDTLGGVGISRPAPAA